MTLLSVERLEARHGLLTAVRGVSFAIDKGETVALVGANGAGKTTLLRAIAGQHPLAGGRVVFNGADISPRGAHARARMGIALVPEGRRLFASLTVEENLLLSRSAGRAGRWTLEAVMEAFPNLKARRARAQRTRRAAGAGIVDLRSVDRHRQPAVPAVRRRHALACALYRRPLL